MVRPINEELYLLQRPLSVMEVDDDALDVSFGFQLKFVFFVLYVLPKIQSLPVCFQDILSGYIVTYNSHPSFDKPQYQVARPDSPELSVKLHSSTPTVSTSGSNSVICKTLSPQQSMPRQKTLVDSGTTKETARKLSRAA